MADTLPAVNLTYDADQAPTVRIGDEAYPDWPAVVAAVTGLENK